MKKLLIILSIVATGLALTACDNAAAPATSNPPQTTGSSVAFKVSKNFTFGNSTYGMSAPVKIWLAGTFNAWKANDETYAMTKDANGDFVFTLNSTKGTVIKFKFIIQTVNSPAAGDWWTSMTQAFDATKGLICLSPAVADVTFEDDGYQGFNAVYTVK